MKKFQNTNKGNVKRAEKKYLTLITDNVIELIYDQDLMFIVNDFIIETISLKDMDDVVYYSERFQSMVDCLRDLCLFEDNNERVSLEELFLINVIKDAFGLDTMLIQGVSEKGFFSKTITSNKKDLLEKIEILKNQLNQIYKGEINLFIVRYLGENVDIQLDQFHEALQNLDDVNELRLGTNYMLKINSNILPQENHKDNPTRVAISKLNDLEYMTPKKVFTIKDFGKEDFFEVPKDLQTFFLNKENAKNNFIKVISGEYFGVYPYFYKKESYKKEEKVIFENVNRKTNVFETITFDSQKLSLKKGNNVIITLSLQDLENQKNGTDMFIKTLDDSKPIIGGEQLLKEIIKKLSK